MIKIILILFIFFIANLHKAKRTDFLLDLGLILLVFFFISLFNRWDLVSIYSKLILIILIIVNLIMVYKSGKFLVKLKNRFVKYLRILIIIIFGLLDILLVKGCYSDQKIEFDFSVPLKTGDYYVVQGGTPPLMNLGHFFNNRLDRYSIDVVKLNSFGFSTNKLIPKSIEDFVIYNDSVFSPCDGVVFRVEQQTDSNFDLQKSQNDTVKLRINNIVGIRTKDADLYLAHLKKGSIKVNIGQEIRKSDFIGLVSNAGAIEAHLHMQLIRDGKAIPFMINGRYLHNNSILRNKPATRYNSQ